MLSPTSVYNAISGSTLYLAGHPSEARPALAHEAVEQGVTAAAVSTRTAGTAVPLDLAVPTHKPWLADALVASG